MFAIGVFVISQPRLCSIHLHAGGSFFVHKHKYVVQIYRHKVQCNTVSKNVLAASFVPQLGYAYEGF